MVDNERKYVASGRQLSHTGDGLFVPVPLGGRTDFVPTQLQEGFFNSDMFNSVSPNVFYLLNELFRSNRFKYIMGVAKYAEGGQVNPSHQIWHSDTLATQQAVHEKTPDGGACGEGSECASGVCDPDAYSCIPSPSGAGASEKSSSDEEEEVEAERTSQYCMILFPHDVTATGQIEVLPGCFGGRKPGEFHCKGDTLEGIHQKASNATAEPFRPTADTEGEFLRHIKAGTVLVHDLNLGHRGRAYHATVDSPRFVWQTLVVGDRVTKDTVGGAWPMFSHVHEQRGEWVERRRAEVLGQESEGSGGDRDREL